MKGAAAEPSVGFKHTASSKLVIVQFRTVMFWPLTSIPSVFSGNVGIPGGMPLEPSLKRLPNARRAFCFSTSTQTVTRSTRAWRIWGKVRCDDEDTGSSAHIQKHVKLRRIHKRNAPHDDVCAQFHTEKIRPMVCVIQNHVPPPIVASAVDAPSALHGDVVAVVKLNCSQASVPAVAATRPRAVQTFCVPANVLQKYREGREKRTPAARHPA